MAQQTKIPKGATKTVRVKVPQKDPNTSITYSKSYGPRTLPVLRLPVFMLLFWLLVMAPFFTVMTTVSDGRVILADGFYVQDSSEILFTIPYNVSYQDGVYDDRIFSVSGASGRTSTNDSSVSSNVSYVNIINNSIIFNDYNKVSSIQFYNDSNIFLGVMTNVNNPTLEPLAPAFISTFNSNQISVPTNATKFTINGWKSLDGLVISFSDFENNIINYSSQTFVPAITYYDVMENARTAEYGNPFEFVNFILQLPNLVGNAKPLEFIGIDTSFADMNQTVLEVRASGYQGLLDLFKVLNPVRWFE